MELSRQLTEEHTKTANGAPISAVEPINSNERSTDENEDDSMNEKTPIIEEHNDSHAKFPGFHNIDLSIKRGEFIIVTLALLVPVSRVCFLLLLVPWSKQLAL